MTSCSDAASLECLHQFVALYCFIIFVCFCVQVPRINFFLLIRIFFIFSFFPSLEACKEHGEEMLWWKTTQPCVLPMSVFSYASWNQKLHHQLMLWLLMRFSTFYRTLPSLWNLIRKFSENEIYRVFSFHSRDDRHAHPKKIRPEIYLN